MEKILSIMQKPGQDPVAKDDVPWWMKFAGRGLGTVGSLSMFSKTVRVIKRHIFHHYRCNPKSLFFLYKNLVIFLGICIANSIYNNSFFT